MIYKVADILVNFLMFFLCAVPIFLGCIAAIGFVLIVHVLNEFLD